MYAIQVVSDIHIEKVYPKLVEINDIIKIKGDILILAGDIGSVYYDHQLKHFLASCVKHFSYVLYIPGNREFSIVKDRPPLSYFKLLSDLKDMCEEIPNLILLNNNSVTVGKYCFIGSTFWSYALLYTPINPIHDIDKSVYNNLHQQSRTYIALMLAYCAKNKLKPIVITHYPPSSQGTIHLRFRCDPLLSLYCSNNDNLLKRSKIWISGHTHQNHNYLINNDNTRFLSNQYRGKGFDKEYTILLPNYVGKSN